MKEQLYSIILSNLGKASAYDAIGLGSHFVAKVEKLFDDKMIHRLFSVRFYFSFHVSLRHIWVPMLDFCEPDALA